MAGGRRGNDGGGVEAMAGLGAGHGEIPAASAGMTELFGAGLAEVGDACGEVLRSVNGPPPAHGDAAEGFEHDAVA